MSLAHRIIPCLDTDGERVVKGVNFLGLRDAGDPVTLAARYNAEGADELVVLDIAASRDRRPTFLETIRRVAAELAIPLTAGGGIRSLDDARAVVRAGADKVTSTPPPLRAPNSFPNFRTNSAPKPWCLRLTRSASAITGMSWSAAAAILQIATRWHGLNKASNSVPVKSFLLPSIATARNSASTRRLQPRFRAQSPFQLSLPAEQDFRNTSRKSFPKVPPTPLLQPPSSTTKCNPSAN